MPPGRYQVIRLREFGGCGPARTGAENAGNGADGTASGRRTLDGNPEGEYPATQSSSTRPPHGGPAARPGRAGETFRDNRTHRRKDSPGARSARLAPIYTEPPAS